MKSHPNITLDVGRYGLKMEETPLNTGKARLKFQILKGLYFKIYRIHAILFLFSLGVSVLSQVLHVYIPVIQEFAAGFLIFWMPGFCVMFLLWDSGTFKTIYLLPLSLAFSQVVVITEGLLCAVFGVLWTPFSVLLATSGFIIGSYCIAWRFKRFRVAQPLRLKKCDSFEVFCVRFNAGKIIPKNFGYLFVLILLLGIYAIVTFPVLSGEDPWFHARLVRFTIDTGIIPFDQFRGATGLHIFGSGFGLLAGWGALTIARWLPIYLVINGDLAFYLVVRRLFKNPQIANLGTFFVSFTPLLYYWGVNNFWSNAIAQPFGLYVLFFLFDALLRKTPATRAQKWAYIIIGIYLSFILRMMHGEIFFMYWLSAAFLVIFYRKNAKSQLCAIIVVLIALCVFLLVDLFYPTYLLLNPIILFALPPLVWLLLIPGIIAGVKILKKLSDFPPGNYEIFEAGNAPDGKIFYAFEKKYLKFIIALAFAVSISLLFTIFDYHPVLIKITGSLLGFVFNFEITVAALGSFIMRRQLHRGKVALFWGLFFLLGATGYFAYDFLITHTMLTNRMLLFSSPGLVLLGIGYVSYALNSGNLNSKKVRRFLAVFAVGSIITCTLNLPLAYAHLESYEIDAASDMGPRIPGDSIIITGFKWGYPIRYFAAEKDISVLDGQANYIFPVEGGDLNRTYFYGLREGTPEKQVYVILDSTFLSKPVHPIIGPDFGIMSMAQVHQYENTSFFNHVYSYGTTLGDWGMLFCLV